MDILTVVVESFALNWRFLPQINRSYFPALLLYETNDRFPANKKAENLAKQKNGLDVFLTIQIYDNFSTLPNF